MPTANLALRFVLELGALAALAHWGATWPGPGAARLALAVAAPLAAAVFWGVLVAPRARIALPRALRMALGLLVLGTAAAALADRGHRRLALWFAIASVANAALMVAWRQDERVAGEHDTFRRARP